MYIYIYMYIRFGSSDQQRVEGAPRLLHCSVTLVGPACGRPTGIAADFGAAVSLASALTILCLGIFGTCSGDTVQVAITCSLESQLLNIPGWIGCH